MNKEKYMKVVKLFLVGVVVALGFSVSSFAKTCDFTIEGNDAMQFNLKEIKVGGVG